MTFRTQSAYVSGAICGSMWWPIGALGGIPLNADLQGAFKRFSEPAGFRDALLLILMERGGDFSGAGFTEDTVIRIERVGVKNGARWVHVRERELREIADVADLVTADAYACDFMD